MEKIYLSNEERIILQDCRDNKISSSFNNHYCVQLLLKKKLIEASYVCGRISYIVLSPTGIEYLRRNPKLKNPSIWDDKKYIINTTISVIAIIISAIALYISIKN